MTVSVFERLLEIIEDRGWHQGDWSGPNGEVCLSEAWHLARADLRSAGAREPRADIQLAALNEAIREVTGGEPWGCASLWQDQQATTLEDVKLVLKIAARKLEEMLPALGAAAPGD